MSSLASKISIISQAFFLLGKSPISTLDINTNKQHAGASQRYDVVVPSILTENTWKHAQKTAVLDQLNEDPPIDRWANAFQLPNKAEMLLTYRTYPANYGYEIMGDKLYTNESSVTLFYIFEPTPDQFPIYFVDYIVYVMAAQCAMAVTGKVEIEELWEKKAREKGILAAASDWQQTPNVAIQYDGLVAAHRAGSGIINYY